MPSVNIKTDYSANGNGQLATVNATFSASSNNLTVFSNIFTAGDIGKYICVAGWLTAIGANGANPAGGQGSAAVTANATISSISVAWNGTSMTVVLGGPAAARSVISVATKIEWGSDDTPAFSAFNTAQSGQANVTLTIPAGRYLMVTGAGGGGASLTIGKGILTLNVTGVGSPTISDMLGGGAGPALNFSGAPLYNDNTAESFIQTVSAGATVLLTVTAADAGKYSASTWAWMTGYDTQGFGAPPNFAFAEFVFITAIDAVAGTVTIQTPLTYSYKSTWSAWVLGSAGSGSPSYTGGAFSLGGPAKLYLMNQAWNAAHTWDGVNFGITPTLMNCAARSITINNATFESFAANVSMQQSFAANNITVPTQWELDKGTQSVTITNSTIYGLLSQSRSPFNVTLSNVTLTNVLNGISANWMFNNCSIPDSPTIFPTAYGPADTLSITNSTFTGGGFGGSTGVGESDIVGTGGWSISNGLMSRLKSGGTGEPPQWAIPGSYFVFSGRYDAEDVPWKCLDLWDNGTTLFLQTDQSVSSFPSGVSGTAIGAHALIARPTGYTGNTGNDDASGWIGSRLFSHWNVIYIGNIGASNAVHLIKIWGLVVSIKITVNSGYSAGTLNLSGPFVVSKPQNAEVMWNPTVDLTIAGSRTITPSGVIGSGGSDANLMLPNSGNVWLVPNQIIPAMSGAVGSGSVQIEIIANQGFPTTVVPLGLRLHA